MNQANHKVKHKIKIAFCCSDNYKEQSIHRKGRGPLGKAHSNNTLFMNPFVLLTLAVGAS